MKKYTTVTVEKIVTDEKGTILDHQRKIETNAPSPVTPQKDGVEAVFEEVGKVFEHVDNIFTKAAKLFKRFKS